MKSNGSLRFENFIVGSSNRLAYSAAQRVSEAPGSTYNPLFIYGASGLGKTHLAAAIAYQAIQTDPDLRVEMVSAEVVVEELNRSIASGTRESFSSHLQSIDILLLDDVQFLTGQKETQSELLRLFNVMQASGRQLVLTSDRPPSEIPDVDERLLSRLSGGLIADVGVPDFEMRLAILRNSAAEHKIDLQEGVLDEIARCITGNVRELKGALNRVIAYQQLEPNGLSVTDVRSLLGYAGHISVKNPSPEVAAEYDGFLDDIIEELEQRVEPWKVRIGEAVSYWQAKGYRTNVLERAMQLHISPDIEGLLSTFSAVVEHLKKIEVQAVTLDPLLRGNSTFRDPELVEHAQALLDRALASILPLPAPNPDLSREKLELGSGNQLALKAADAIVDMLGKKYNPLFIHGTSGNGKTHIAHAIANSIIHRYEKASVACIAASVFVDELVAAMQEGGVERWRARYRSIDALIFDDVQQLSDKERTQEELFHLFNTLYQSGAQVVFTSDRSPRELTGIADRLRSRFEGGLVVSLQVPDRLMREKLVRRWLIDSGNDYQSALVSWLADREYSSARELLGVVTKLAAAADLLSVPLDIHLARRELDGLESLRSVTPRAGSILNDESQDIFFLDEEKVIWDWPFCADRLIEDLR